MPVQNSPVHCREVKQEFFKMYESIKDVQKIGQTTYFVTLNEPTGKPYKELAEFVYENDAEIFSKLQNKLLKDQGSVCCTSVFTRANW